MNETKRILQKTVIKQSMLPVTATIKCENLTIQFIGLNGKKTALAWNKHQTQVAQRLVDPHAVLFTINSRSH